MPSYKLTYFNGMGRAEVTRLLFALSDVEYEDVRIVGEQWKTLKPETPFGALPILEVDGETFCQGKAIEFFVAKKTGRAGDNEVQMAKGHMVVECVEDAFKPAASTMALSPEEKKKAREDYCKDKLPEFLKKFEQMLEKAKNESGLYLGDKITWPDLAVFHFVTYLPVLDHMTVDTSGFPKISALIEKVKNDPKIGAWLAKRPKTAF